MFGMLLWLCEQIKHAADDEMAGRGERIRQELADLYRQLQDNKITEQAFDRREGELLDQLDALEAEGHPQDVM